jgi:hypothetical protein
VDLWKGAAGSYSWALLERPRLGGGYNPYISFRNLEYLQFLGIYASPGKVGAMHDPA